MSQLESQQDFYSNGAKEQLNKDTEKTLQRYLKKIFRQIKFLSDLGKLYKEPNFVSHMHGKKSQAAELCEYLWKCLGTYLDIAFFT